MNSKATPVFSQEFRHPENSLPVFDARQILGDSTTAHILLDGQTYILRLTRQGKLILTK